MNNFEKKVHNFWNNASCGDDLYLLNTERSSYSKQDQERYRLGNNGREFLYKYDAVRVSKFNTSIYKHCINPDLNIPKFNP